MWIVDIINVLSENEAGFRERRICRDMELILLLASANKKISDVFALAMDYH